MKTRYNNLFLGLLSIFLLIAFVLAFFYFLPLAQSQRKERERHVSNTRALELQDKQTIKEWETKTGMVFEASRSGMPIFREIQSNRNVIISQIYSENQEKEKWNGKLKETKRYGFLSSSTIILLAILLILASKNRNSKED